MVLDADDKRLGALVTLSGMLRRIQQIVEITWLQKEPSIVSRRKRRKFVLTAILNEINHSHSQIQDNHKYSLLEYWCYL